MITIYNYTYDDKKRYYFDVIALICLCLLPWVYILIKDLLYLPACPMKSTLGIPCPGCGIRKSLDLFINFNLIQALKIYPPLIMLGSLYLCLLISLFLKIIYKKYIYINNKIVNIGIILIVGSILGNWIIQIIIL
jgi:hypothetical protein